MVLLEDKRREGKGVKKDHDLNNVRFGSFLLISSMQMSTFPEKRVGNRRENEEGGLFHLRPLVLV